MGGVNFTNAMRTNLLSLQGTQSLISATQNRLATGMKVSSAIDDPRNFFQAQALNNRASDLTRRLDGMGLGIKTIEAADKGLKGITKLVESAQATIRQALNEPPKNQISASGSSLATATEAAAANKSRKEVALDKLLVDDNGSASNDATATYSGNLGIGSDVFPFTTPADYIALFVQLGSSAYTVQLNPTTATLRDVVNEINKSGLATSSVSDDGAFLITATGSDELRFGLGSGSSEYSAARLASLGGMNFAVFPTGFTSYLINNSTVCTNLIQQFNNLRLQIDEMAKDSGFNGVNLLRGDELQVVFNEKTGNTRAKLDIQGSTVSSANLGIGMAVNSGALTGEFNIQNDNDLNTTMATLTTALTSLKSMASSLGSNFAVVQIRKDFTKNMIDILKAGADDLVLADSNEEGARLLALNTRAQLSLTALSMASKADQAVLRLF